MPDPAVEAAQRALTNIGYGRSVHVQPVGYVPPTIEPVLPGDDKVITASPLSHHRVAAVASLPR